jgi:hypothetical protein
MADILNQLKHEVEHRFTFGVNYTELGIDPDTVDDVVFTFIDRKFTGFKLPFQIINAKWQWRLLVAIKAKYDELKADYGD